MKEKNIHKALSSRPRREILIFLGNDKKYLSEIAKHINKSPQTADFHLSILEDNNIVKSSEEGGHKFYKLKNKKILKYIEKEEPLPHKHHPKPPHEIVLDIKKDLNKRMDELDKKMDKILKKLK